MNTVIGTIMGVKMGAIVRAKASAVVNTTGNAIVNACVKPPHYLNDELFLCIEP